MASADFALEIVEDFETLLSSGKRVRVPLLLRHFGAERGMLITTEYDVIEDVAEELIDEGFGYSILDEPRGDESYDRDAFMEILDDWGRS